MAIIDDPDFLTSPAKQLRAVQELANLRTRIVDLETELLTRRHERRELIQRLTEHDLEDQRRQGVARPSRTTAHERARASDAVRQFDANVRALREREEARLVRWRRDARHRAHLRVAERAAPQCVVDDGQ